MSKRAAYRAYMRSLWAQYEPRVIAKGHWRGPMEDVFSYSLYELAKAAQIVRAIESGIGFDAFTDNALETRSLALRNRVLTERY